MNKFEDIRGVAFGPDGTLVDSTSGLVTAVGMVLYALELPAADEERVTTWIGSGADILTERVLTWVCQECATLYKTMDKPPVDDDIPAEEQIHILRKLFDCHYGEITEEGAFLFPHVADMLGVLQAEGLLLDLVTNKPTSFVAPLLGALNITKYFSMVIGDDDVQNKEPHLGPLLLATERMGIAPQQMLFVGDSRNDAQAARAAGCPSVGLTYGYNYGGVTDLSQPDAIYQSLNDPLSALGFSHSKNQESKNDQAHRFQWRTAFR